MFSFTFISLLIRGIQAGFIIIVLGLTGRLVNIYSGNVDKFNLGLATSILSLFYFIGLTIVSLWPKFISIGIAFICESILTILWLASFACLADIWGSVSCNAYSYYSYSTLSDCQVGKAALGLAVIVWLLFMTSLALMIFYSIIPISRTSGFASCFSSSHSFYPGLIVWDESSMNYSVNDWTHSKGPGIQNP